MPKSVLCLLALFFPFLLMAEVTLSVKKTSTDNLLFTWANTSALPYYLGGARIYTDGYVHPGMSQITNWVYNQKNINGESEQTILYKSSIATVQNIPMGGTTTATARYDYSGKPVFLPKRFELLLKTGSAGKVDDPITEDPIDTSDIDSLIKTPNFYNKDYRYIDTLGAHGGLYSGGIMDTWLGETQVIAHFSDKTWSLHGTEQASFKLNATGGDPLFWMSVIMGQEYFHADMQWMLAKGAQETGAGTGTYNGTNGEGAFGPWEVELGTGKSREAAYPYFFENGTIDNFWSDATSPLNSANVVNGYIYSIACVRYMYDLWNYATDACWKEILVESKSRYYALSILLGGYNNGISDAQYVLKEFWHVDTYGNYITDPNGHNAVEAKMNKGYVPGVIGGVKNLEEGSKAAFADKSLELIDMELSLTDIKRFFYGDGGDHTKQGDGGLLAHFDVDRNEFNTLIEVAFNKLKGKAPSTQGKDAISLRYDFLTLLRVVKKDFQVTWVRPTGPGEWITAVKQQSQKGGCDSLEFDEEYPYGEISGAPEFVTDFIVDIHGRDNQMVEEVVWTMDPEWKKWNKATYKSGSAGDQIFTITIPREVINAQFGDNTGTYWYMVTDASGNSVVKKDIIKGNPIKYAAAIDNNGDGFTDSIKIQIVEGALENGETVGGYDELKYSWPTKNNLTKTTSVDVAGEYLYVNSLSDDAGAGLGQVTVKYPSMSDAAERDIVDSVGPAVTYAALLEGLSEDTLQIVPSEKVDNIASKNYEYLYLIKGSDETKEQSKEVVSVADGDTLLFLFEKNIVSDKDSVRFIYDCELTDIVGVKPQSNNIRKPIKKSVTLEPELDSAIALDTKGDGMADLITVHFTPSNYSGALGLNQHKNLKYSWPTNTALKKPDNTVVVGTSLNITDAALTDGAGLGKIECTYGVKNYNDIIGDRVGPAITAARFSMADAGRAYDTLALTISEALATPVSQTEAYLFLDENKKENSSEILKVSANEWLFLFSKGTVVDRDSVKLTFTDAQVEDLKGNRPLDINQWVPITKSSGKEMSFSSAYIKDLDGDGDGDSIRVTLTTGEAEDHYTVADLDSGRFSWPTDALDEVLNSSSFTEVTATTFSFTYASTAGEGAGKISLYFPNKTPVEGIIEDSVGPVITTATLSIHDSNRDRDTLVLTVSEALSGENRINHTYLFLNEGLKEVSDTVLKKSANEYWFIFPKGVVADRDSVKFTYDNNPVTDGKGNQPMDINQWIPINIVGGREPVLDTAFIVDTDGDGDGDSIAVTLSLGEAKDRYTVDSLVEGNFSWPDILLGNALVPANFLTKSDNSFSFLYDSDEGAGKGKIAITFPEDYTLSGEIQDAVGPVIDSAICLQVDTDRDSDTLILQTSEALAENFSDGTTYLILFEDSSDVNGDTISVKSVTLDGDNYRFMVAKNAVTYGDWVQFRFNSGLTDTVKNAPMDINRKVLIDVKGPITPRITEAAIFDIYGITGRLDGHGDSIHVRLALSDDPLALTADSLKEISYSWGGSSNTKTKGDITILNDSTFSFADTTLSGGSGTGSLTMRFVNPAYSVTGLIADSVAPVIASATYYNWSSVKDTLVVTFSEEIGKTGSKTPFLVTGNAITVLKNKSSGTVVTYSIENNAELAYSDSIWIKGNEEVSDASNNEQESDLNVKVPLTYFRVTELQAATYFESDTRPDGYIDEVRLSFDSDLTNAVASALSGKITLSKDRSFTINDIVKTDNRVITVEVRQDKSSVEPITSRESYDTITISGAADGDTLIVASSGSIDVADSLAPVITAARFIPAEESESDSTLIDTLVLNYSESVRNITRDDPFTFSDASNSNSEYSLLFTGNNSGKESVIYYNEFTLSNILPGNGDSVWIDESGDITDSKGIVQERNSIPVPLTVGMYKRNYKVSISPTPFNNEFYDDSVVTIRIQPRTRMLPDDITAEFVILDKVGNEILKVSADEFGKIENNMLSYSFKPRNGLNRELGAGTYAVELFITAEGTTLRWPLIMAIQEKAPGKSE